MVTIDCTAYGPVIGKNWAVIIATTPSGVRARIVVRADDVADAVLKAVMYAAKRGFGPESTSVVSCEQQ